MARFDRSHNLWAVHPPLILDALSFYQKSRVSDKMFVDAAAMRILEQLAMEYNFIALFSPPKEQNVLTRMKNFILPSTSDSGMDELPLLGEIMVLPTVRWPRLLRENLSPLLYLGNPSDPAVLSDVRVDDRMELLFDIRTMRYAIGNYRVANSPAMPEKSSIQIGRDGHRAYTAARSTRFEDNFR